MIRYVIYKNNKGAVIPAHNCNARISDGGDAFSPDWKPFPFFYKGTLPCKHSYRKKYFPPDRSNVISPAFQYISDRRSCGVTRLQLASVMIFFGNENRISIMRFLNGSVGYRIYSEDSQRVQGGFTVFDLQMCIKQNTKTITVIPDICLERRSIGTTEKDRNRNPFLNFESAGKSVLKCRMLECK